MRTTTNASQRRRSETGAAATEYALLVTLIALAVVTAIVLVGTSTGTLFERPCDEVASFTERCA